MFSEYVIKERKQQVYFSQGFLCLLGASVRDAGGVREGGTQVDLSPQIMQDNFPSRDFYLLTSTESLLPCKVTGVGSGIRTGISLGLRQPWLGSWTD